MPMARTWNGMTVLDKSKRAQARALVGFSMQVVRETKIITHRISGSLARSVHAAPLGYEGYEEDQAQAEGGADLSMVHSGVDTATPVPTGYMLEVGSWMPYACVEWVGRAHPGLTQGLEIARPTFDKLIMQAFREEGL